MGGNAFSSHPHPLPMPRMPPHIYYSVLERVQTQLRTVYDFVETPIEAAAKKDHGDIDVIVAMKDKKPNAQLDVVKKVLGAEAAGRTNASSTSHFAIKWPEEDGDRGDGDDAKGVAHGDMWMMLGAMIRRFGFVATPKGFFYRIPELEGWNKDKARINLTDEPDEVLKYLGFDVKRYWSMFHSRNEMMDYISTCRFHDPMKGQQYDDQEVKAKFEVNAHDRSKAHKRPVFRYWLEEYLPAHRDAPKGTACELTRDEIVEDVKAFFGQEVAEEHDRRKEHGMNVISVDKLWSDIRKAMPCTDTDLGYTMKGLKHEIVGEAKGKPEADLSDVQAAYLNGRFDEVQTWAKENWEKVKDAQIQRDRVQSTTKLLAHLEKMKLTEDSSTHVSEEA